MLASISGARVEPGKGTDYVVTLQDSRTIPVEVTTQRTVLSPVLRDRLTSERIRLGAPTAVLVVPPDSPLLGAESRKRLSEQGITAVTITELRETVENV